MSLNNCQAPSDAKMIKVCKEYFAENKTDSLMEYLEECASYDYQNPDKCSSWAVSFYEDNQDEIEGKV